MTDLEREFAVARNTLRAERGMIPLVEPLGQSAEPPKPLNYEPPISRGVAIAALFALRISYGQLMHLFGVSKTTVYEHITRKLPPEVRALRGRAGSKPMISYEQATMYFEALGRAGAHKDAVTLAARLQELTKDVDWRE